MGGTREHSLALQMVWPIVRAFGRRGLDVRALVASGDLSVTGADAASPWARVPWSVIEASLPVSEAAFGSNDLGVQAALASQPTDFGDLVRLCQAQPTLRDAIAAHDFHYRLVTTVGVIETVQREHDVVRRLHAAPGIVLNRTMVEYVFGLWLVLARHITGRPKLRVESVCFRHAAPDRLDAHKQLFGGQVLFGQPEDCLIISQQTLELPSVHANRFEAHAFEQKLQQYQSAVPTRSARERVEEHVLFHLASGAPSADAVAKRLGVGARHLHRLLIEDGTTYRGVVDETRKRLAMEYLARTDMSVADVASRLGFADVQGFHRAFRRLTGLTPSAARKSA